MTVAEAKVYQATVLTLATLLVQTPGLSRGHAHRQGNAVGKAEATRDHLVRSEEAAKRSNLDPNRQAHRNGDIDHHRTIRARHCLEKVAMMQTAFLARALHLESAGRILLRAQDRQQLARMAGDDLTRILALRLHDAAAPRHKPLRHHVEMAKRLRAFLGAPEAIAPFLDHAHHLQSVVEAIQIDQCHDRRLARLYLRNDDEARATQNRLARDRRRQRRRTAPMRGKPMERLSPETQSLRHARWKMTTATSTHRGEDSWLVLVVVEPEPATSCRALHWTKVGFGKS